MDSLAITVASCINIIAILHMQAFQSALKSSVETEETDIKHVLCEINMSVY